MKSSKKRDKYWGSGCRGLKLTAKERRQFDEFLRQLWKKRKKRKEGQINGRDRFA